MKQTVAQLKAEAKALKIPRYSKMKKADLIEAIAAHKEYDPADNSAKCYSVAIAAMRDKLKSFRREVIGDCTLYLGDCAQIIPLLPKADAVVTDPPYGISDAAFKIGKRSGKRTGGDNTWHADSWWDAEIDPAWPALCSRAAPVLAWFGHWRKRHEIEAAVSMPLRCEIVWAKDCHVGPPCPVAMRDERIWLFAEDGIKGRTFETSVWDVPIIPTWAHKNHKNEKPIALMRKLIGFLDAETILDPFMGSGTTGVACVKMGRQFIGIEQDEAHFATACRRIEEAYKQPDFFVPRPAPAVQLGMLEAAE